jgi:hypothetical protein
MPGFRRPVAECLPAPAWRRTEENQPFHQEAPWGPLVVGRPERPVCPASSCAETASIRPNQLPGRVPLYGHDPARRSSSPLSRRWTRTSMEPVTRAAPARPAASALSSAWSSAAVFASSSSDSADASAGPGCGVGGLRVLHGSSAVAALKPSLESGPPTWLGCSPRLNRRGRIEATSSPAGWPGTSSVLHGSIAVAALKQHAADAAGQVVAGSPRLNRRGRIEAPGRSLRSGVLASGVGCTLAVPAGAVGGVTGGRMRGPTAEPALPRAGGTHSRLLGR